MLAMTLLVSCALVGSAADDGPKKDADPTTKAPPRLLVVRLKGDALVSQYVVTEVVPVTVTEKVKTNQGDVDRTVTRYVPQMRTVEQSFDLKAVTVTTAGGKRLSAEEVRNRLGTRPQAVATSGDGQPIDQVYLDALGRDTLVIMTPRVEKK